MILMENTERKYKILKEDSLLVTDKGQILEKEELNAMPTEKRPKVHTLYRIQAIRDIPGIVKAGEKGGYIEHEDNLSHDGNCWLKYGYVYNGSKIENNAQVMDDVFLNDTVVAGNATVEEDTILDRCLITDHSIVKGFSQVTDTETRNNAQISDSRISRCSLRDNVVVTQSWLKDTKMRGNTRAIDTEAENAYIIDDACVISAHLLNGTFLHGRATIENSWIGNAILGGDVKVQNCAWAMAQNIQLNRGTFDKAKLPIKEETKEKPRPNLKPKAKKTTKTNDMER